MPYDLGLQDVMGNCYTGHHLLANALAYYLPDKKDAKILDVAAGTGLVAEQVDIH